MLGVGCWVLVSVSVWGSLNREGPTWNGTVRVQFVYGSSQIRGIFILGIKQNCHRKLNYFVYPIQMNLPVQVGVTGRFSGGRI